MKTIDQIYKENTGLRKVGRAALHHYRAKLEKHWDYAPAKAPLPTRYTKSGEKQIIAWLESPRKSGPEPKEAE